MTDGAFADRISQLKARWESDSSSRIFLQLAEEYRHLGRVREALAVLDKGLQEHPGYLSALVAKGRCHLELGEGENARSVLERVVKQDATQMVANKLLVRTYLDTGDPVRARERLDLYSLLNDSDPEIAELHRQIKTMDRPKEQVPADSPFDLGAPPAARPVEDIFDLGPAAVAPRNEPGEVFPLAGTAPVDEDLAGDPFPELASGARRQRYLESLASEGLFEVAPPPDAAPPDAAPPDAAPPEEPPMAEAEELQAEPLPEPAAVAVEDTSWLDEEVAEPVRAAEPVATATLGDLYLRQGHLDEAERLFREVLDHEPGSATALIGLSRVESARRALSETTPAISATSTPLDARQLLTGFPPGRAGGGTTARKIFLLNRYLDRLRGRQRHVS